ncbi:MAG: replication initiator protein [Microviridae sp.]|nr:MAG: replication initiator protein [Microviridae sp.]
MPCYKPLIAYRSSNGSVNFVQNRFHGSGDTLSLPCGRCIGCRLEKSREWAMRCMHEAQMHERNCFVSLTYNDFNLPEDGSLRYKDFQDFMRKLRYEFGKVRFYMCGEYGDDNGRPHFHALLFGVDFDDKVYFKKSPAGFPLYRSRKLEVLWPYGYSSIGSLTFESAGYVARYVMKKVTGDAAEAHYRVVNEDTGEVKERKPEFGHMSLKPGIGAAWLDKFSSDVYPGGRVVVRGAEGMSPRYYDLRWKKSHPDVMEQLAFERDRAARLRYLDNTDERLAVKEKVRLAGIQMLKRKLT